MTPAPTNDQLSDRPGEPQSTVTVPGWYECRFINGETATFRIAVWWNGEALTGTPDCATVKCDMERYTDFRPLTVNAELVAEVERLRERLETAADTLDDAGCPLDADRIRAALHRQPSETPDQPEPREGT